MAGKKTERTSLWLACVRLRKLLENARALMEQIDDGKEKIKGEFIFDMRYNLSLIERIIETSGDMVFDAGVLAPEGSEALFSIHDRCRKHAEKAFRADRNLGTPLPGEDDDSLENIPEFRMLADFLEWVENPEANISIMKLLKMTFDHVFEALAGKSLPDAGAPQLSLGEGRIDLVDLGGGISGPGGPGAIGLDGVRCKPLHLLTADIDSAERQTALKNAFAAVTDVHLHFQGSQADSPFFVEATYMNHVDSDFAFLYMPDSGRKPDLSPGFRMEKTPNGWMAWTYGKNPENTADEIGRLGDFLFAP